MIKCMLKIKSIQEKSKTKQEDGLQKLNKKIYFRKVEVGWENLEDMDYPKLKKAKTKI